MRNSTIDRERCEFSENLENSSHHNRDFRIHRRIVGCTGIADYSQCQSLILLLKSGPNFHLPRSEMIVGRCNKI
jgi:hypothetical protein